MKKYLTMFILGFSVLSFADKYNFGENIKQFEDERIDYWISVGDRGYNKRIEEVNEDPINYDVAAKTFENWYPKHKEKMDKYLGWWKNEAQMIHIFKDKNGVYRLVNYKHIYYKKVVQYLAWDFMNTEEKQEILNEKNKEDKKYKDFNSIKARLIELNKEWEQTDILGSDNLIFKNDEPGVLFFNEDGDFIVSRDFWIAKNPHDDPKERMLSFVTLTENDELFLTKKDLHKVSYEDFVKKYKDRYEEISKENANENLKWDYKKLKYDVEAKDYFNFLFIYKPLRRMTESEIKQLEKEEIVELTFVNKVPLFEDMLLEEARRHKRWKSFDMIRKDGKIVF